MQTEKLKLNELVLKNFATFEDQTINFHGSFNAIIGETGSGKSLILDALQLILGSRADKRLVRKDCEFATIEACFQSVDNEIKDFFNELGYPFENDEIVIKRIIYSSGKTKSLLNFQVCSLQILQNFSKRFIDLVGQFENQKLLSEKYQLVLLDNYSNNSKMLKDFQDEFAKLSTITEKIDHLKNNRSEHVQRLDYINFQLDELDKLDPSVEDELDLIQKKEIVVNFEARSNFINKVNNLFESDYGISNSLSILEKEFHSAASFLSREMLDDFSTAKDILSDLTYKISSLEQSQDDEFDLDSVMERLDFYQKLKRKFGTDTEGLANIREELLLEKANITNIEDNLYELEQLQFKLNQRCYKIANDLHASRLKNSKSLSSELTNIVQNLRMNGSQIKIQVNKNEILTSTGLSQINFLAETNPGEGFYKVKDAASGGELSRILLALRQILSSKDSINIFLFDEIDTGIGGETALKIGEALANVASASQVIAITHLPQIAKYADQLIIVNKEIIQDAKVSRTFSSIKEVSGEAIREEVLLMTPLN